VTAMRWLLLENSSPSAPRFVIVPEAGEPNAVERSCFSKASTSRSSAKGPGVVLPTVVVYPVELSIKSATELYEETKASILLLILEASAETFRVPALAITTSAVIVRPAMP